MQEQTLELLRVLQLSERDAGTFAQIQARLPTERARLTSADDRSALADISELLEVWAETAPSDLAAAATVEAAQIADEDLEQAERAVTLYALALQRAPTALEPLKKLDALLCRRGERERLETALEKHVDSMSTAPDVDPLSIAFVLRRLGQLRAGRSGDLGPAIDAYERAVDLAAEPEVISELAGLYAKRGSNGDAAQAAELYSTLGEVLGAERGVPMLERALDLAPGHDAALDVLETYVPAAEQPARLRARWAAYVDSSENEAGVDRRRLLLARAHAGLGRYRDALISLGPLVDKSDAEALRMQAACLSSLQEARASDPDVSSAVRPPTLVGFRVPAPGDEPGADEPNAARAARAKSEAALAMMVRGTAAPPEGRPESPPLAAVAAAATREASKPELRAPSVSPVPEVAVAPTTATEPASKAQAPERRASSTPEQPSQSAQRPVSASAAKSQPQPQRSSMAASAVKRAPASEAVPGSTAGAEPKKPQSEVRLARARAARSGHTLVGFRIPTDDDDAPVRELSPEPLPAAVESRPSNGSSAVQPRAATSRSAKQAAPAAAPARVSQAPAARAAELKAARLRASRPPRAAVAREPVAAPSEIAVEPIRRSVPPRLPRRASAPSTPSVEPRPEAPSAPEPAYVESAPLAEASTPIAHSAPPSPSFAATDAAAFEPKPRGSGGSKRLLIVAAAGAVLVVAVLGIALRSKPSPAAVPSHGDAVAPQPAAAAPVVVPPSAAVAPPVAAPAPVAPAPPEPRKLAVVPAPEKKPTKVEAQPTLKAGRAHVVGGGLTAQQIALGLEDALPVIEHCYTSALKRHPQLQGRIVFAWTVGKTGEPSHVRKLTATLDDAKLQQCSLDALRKAHFAKPRKKTSDITWPLEFKKS